MPNVIHFSPPYDPLYEPMAVIEEWALEPTLACALIYIARAARKHHELQDLQKAVSYLERTITRLQTRKNPHELPRTSPL